MKFEKSKYYNQLKSKKVELSFGTFYFLEKFFINEINEGIHFDILKIQELVSAIGEHYGDNFKIGHVSNRINSYSFEPQLWVDFYKEYNFISGSAIIAYSSFNSKSVDIENMFSKNTVKGFHTLDEGIKWMLDFNKI